MDRTCLAIGNAPAHRGITINYWGYEYGNRTRIGCVIICPVPRRNCGVTQSPALCNFRLTCPSRKGKQKDRRQCVRNYKALLNSHRRYPLLGFKVRFGRVSQPLSHHAVIVILFYYRTVVSARYAKMVHDSPYPSSNWWIVINRFSARHTAPTVIVSIVGVIVRIEKFMGH